MTGFLEIPDFTCTLTLGGYVSGALAALGFMLWRKHDSLGKNIGLGFSVAASLSGCVLSVSVLLSGSAFQGTWGSIASLGTFGVHIDRLSALFTGVVSLLSVAVSVYSIGYTKEYFGRRNVSFLVFLYNVFLLSMVLVVVAADALFFLIAWESMSLAAYFLIVYEHEDSASRKAGILYIVMTHLGTAFLVMMFLLLAGDAQSFSFDAIRSTSGRLPAAVKTWIFLGAIVGFGTKAGIIPFHIWLPEAHPAAPSNISALMSGVMIKTGIYGMVRVFFDLLGADLPEWGGVLILILAVTSSVLGVLYALMEHDLKRLLAFHSIENIGIILMGVGAALLFSSLGNKPLAAIALLAGLFHVLNHAIFKGLLFLGAGSVYRTTHSRNIDELGGLIGKMPWTSFFFLVGAVAISGLPPLNGFISEWLTFQALLLGFHIPDLTVKIAAPLTVALLALTGALAAACFVKAFGITFLGLPRSKHGEQAHEAPFTMTASMGLLALLCVVFGVAPGLVVSVLYPLVGSLLGTPLSGQVVLSGGMLSIPQSPSTTISPPVLTGLLVGMTMIPVVAGFLVGGKLRKRVAATWACGLPAIGPRMQYTAAGFSKPIRMIFTNIYRARHEIEISEEVSPYFRPNISYELKTESVFLKYLYEPVYRFGLSWARISRRVQTGHIQSYLAYIFITLVLLLLFAR